MKCKASLEEKRRVLNQAGSKFFSVDFVKKDGSLRHMEAKKWIESAFSHGSKNAQASTLAHKPEYFLAVDTAKGEFRAINLNTLVRCKVNGTVYEFED